MRRLGRVLEALKLKGGKRWLCEAVNRSWSSAGPERRWSSEKFSGWRDWPHGPGTRKGRGHLWQAGQRRQPPVVTPQAALASPSPGRAEAATVLPLFQCILCRRPLEPLKRSGLASRLCSRRPARFSLGGLLPGRLDGREEGLGRLIKS